MSGWREETKECRAVLQTWCFNIKTLQRCVNEGLQFKKQISWWWYLPVWQIRHCLKELITPPRCPLHLLTLSLSWICWARGYTCILLTNGNPIIWSDTKVLTEHRDRAERLDVCLLDRPSPGPGAREGTGPRRTGLKVSTRGASPTITLKRHKRRNKKVTSVHFLCLCYFK